MTLDLDTLIRELRLELAGELPLKLHEFDGEPPVDENAGPARRSGNRSAWTGLPVEATNGHPASLTGLPFAHQFDRYLSSQHGGDFLASDCFEAIRDWCRIEHWREAHSGDNPFAWNLCARIAIAVVELRQPLHFIADSESIDLWLTRNLLTTSLEYAQEWRVKRRAGVIISDESHRELDEAEALPVVLAREHSVEHEQKVWDLWRANFPFIRSWDAELNRRRAYHAIHCHGRCPLLMTVAA